MLDIKPTETSILHVNNNSFTGPLITGAFEKRAPESELWRVWLCRDGMRDLGNDVLKESIPEKERHLHFLFEKIHQIP